MSPMNFLLSLATLALSSSAFAEGTQLTCTSLRNTYELNVNLDGNASTLEVVRSPLEGNFDLVGAQTIRLRVANENSEAWEGYVGESARKQVVRFRAKKSDLAHRGKMVAYMNVGNADNETEELNFQLNCLRR